MPRPAGGREWYTTKRVLTLVDAQQVTARVFINDDEYGLHQDYEKWLEELAPHAPSSQYQHNRTGEDACGVAVPCAWSARDRPASRGPLPCARPQDWPGRCPERRDKAAGEHLKRNVARRVARDGPRRAAVIAVTNGPLDFDAWERVFGAQQE